MAKEETTETATETATESTALTLADLRKFVQDTVTSIVKTGTNVRDDAHDKGTEHTADKLDRGSSIADEVNKQVARIREKEARDNRDKELDTKLAELGAKLEVTPVERSRLHRFMGWGD